MLTILFRILLVLAALPLLLIVAYRWIDPPATPLMAIRWVEGAAIDRRPVALAAIAPALPRAVIASEDNRFCTHHGIDFEAVQDALDEQEETGRLRGASTITMQVARNLFLWPGGGFVRKAIEAPLALAIDAFWPKRRIMEVYLNIAEWGDGIFGAEAAARRHFRKAARDLTRTEAARLAAVLPNPRRWNAGAPTGYIQRRTATIDARTNQLGPANLGCIRQPE
ncbi:monofunctional biosynthetic peptidoglycan transglycosylase [Stella humosa]|uniref:Biosynthetic peptidoglycan transglycosylase n=1 Tax=Stella humosa TaxID=94 RepID=A0A3N1M9Y6_9PROT|nr:monofunctional biosynthetic peptidoglycan transglycosylase [Stella humosa]ROP99609.1 monofunctional biosynthetic peptidoglycan transglycosylase [Stella humosa]BBK31166.1 monofunctional biosynthetic peptidoglycan transglycosylase [Stella humosa]